MIKTSGIGSAKIESGSTALELLTCNQEYEEEELEDERLKQQAVAERERGNASFKAGNYEMAIEKYTAGTVIPIDN